MHLLSASLMILEAVFYSMSFCGCSNLWQQAHTEQITLQLPSWPPEETDGISYPALSRWLVCVEGEEARAEVSLDEASSLHRFFLPPQQRTLTITTLKNCPLAVTAYPITLCTDKDATYEQEDCNQETYETAFFKPAGMIYPCRKEYITWEGGFLAWCMQKIIRSRAETGIYPEHIAAFLSSFNWKKAQETIDKKIVNARGTFFNPWLIDDFELLDNLCYGEFKTSYLNMTDTMTVTQEHMQECALPSEMRFFSSFVLENGFLRREKKVLMKKNVSTLFYSYEDYGMIFKGSSTKNISLEYINLPIFIEESQKCDKAQEVADDSAQRYEKTADFNSDSSIFRTGDERMQKKQRRGVLF